MADKDVALDDLMELLSVPGPSGSEKEIVKHIISKCKAIPGFKGEIIVDNANQAIEHGGDTGNLIIRFPGDAQKQGLLFSAHMDTIPFAVGASPVIRDGFVRNQKPGTSLGADCRAGCAILLQLIRKLSAENGNHPPVTFAFFVQEENGEWGSRMLSGDSLGKPAPTMAFNFDGEEPEKIAYASVGVERFHIDIKGKSAHAGINPEEGISAALIFSNALGALSSGGWFGRIRRQEGCGTANIGVLQGGKISNAVMPDLYAYGEARSPDPRFRMQIMDVWKAAFNRAVAAVTNTKGESGDATFRPGSVSESYHLKADSPVVRLAAEAISRCGLTPMLEVCDGVGDPNWLNAKGIPTVGLGMGVHKCHSTDECVSLREFHQSCRIAKALLESV